MIFKILRKFTRKNNQREVVTVHFDGTPDCVENLLSLYKKLEKKGDEVKLMGILKLESERLSFYSNERAYGKAFEEAMKMFIRYNRKKGNKISCELLKTINDEEGINVIRFS